jgi:hypothetical protein
MKRACDAYSKQSPSTDRTTAHVIGSQLPLRTRWDLMDAFISLCKRPLMAYLNVTKTYDLLALGQWISFPYLSRTMKTISIETTPWSCIHSGYCASVSRYQGINPYCQGDNTIRVFDPFFLTFNSISFYFQILSSESISSGVVQTPVTLRHGSAVHSSIRYILALDAAHNHQAAPLEPIPLESLDWTT